MDRTGTGEPVCHSARRQVPWRSETASYRTIRSSTAGVAARDTRESDVAPMVEEEETAGMAVVEAVARRQGTCGWRCERPSTAAADVGRG